jgi:hypothetical protein
MRTQDPSGPFRKNQNKNRSPQVKKNHASENPLSEADLSPRITEKLTAEAEMMQADIDIPWQFR